MNQLSPKQIILHCGLHKTGTTYIQRNLQSNQAALRDLGILYMGPTTFKNRCKELWRYIEFGQNTPPVEKIRAQTLTTLIDLAENKPEQVDIIFISFESIFGTLSKGLIEGNRRRRLKKENKAGLYRYARKRVNRLINSLEIALSKDNINWTILYATRQKEEFIRSCHTQLLKEGNILEDLTFEQFSQSKNFIYSDEDNLRRNLEELKTKQNIDIVSFSYDTNSSKINPSVYLWNFIKLALPAHSSEIKEAFNSNATKLNIANKINPSLNDRGLEIADQARPLFDQKEWKLFRKFLEKNFAK